VEEIVGIPGRVESDVIETEPLFVRQGERLVRTRGMPPHAERFDRLGIDVRSLLNGGG
jgi:pilus assembly protein CpaF